MMAVQTHSALSVVEIYSLLVFLVIILLFFTSSSDLGVHVDGFISNVAHSFVIGATKVCASLLSLCFSLVSFDSNLCLCLQFVTKPFYPLLSQDNPVTGRKADVVKAAHLCAEAALRLVKPGNQVREWGRMALGGRTALWDGHCEGMGGFVQTGRSGYLC